MKLSLRDFFWIIFVAAISLSWWLDRSEQVRRTALANRTAAEAARLRDLWKVHARAAQKSLAVEGQRITYFANGASLIEPLVEDEADVGVLSLRDLHEVMKAD